ncbi:MAG: helix-turn-helix domain-containing protein [Acutalibacteraceae bacterium]
MAKRPVQKFDFKPFGQAIKAARKAQGESRKKATDEMYLSPRYLANIENKGQHPSLQIFYELVTRYGVSVDQFFFPEKSAEKGTQRRQLDALLDGMSEQGLRILTAAAREIAEVEKEN